jgi:hypothetical protein
MASKLIRSGRWRVEAGISFFIMYDEEVFTCFGTLSRADDSLTITFLWTYVFWRSLHCRPSAPMKIEDDI